MGNHFLQVVHKSIGELIERGFTVIEDDDQADEFEDLLAPAAAYERSSGGHRFTLTEREWRMLHPGKPYELA